MRAVKVTHTCDTPFAMGKHKGASSSSTLYNKGSDFLSCGVAIGMPIYNTTQDTDGLVTAVLEDSITDDTNSWDNGDSYEVYIQTKDTIISSIYTDRLYGKKVVRGDILTRRGFFPSDADIDEDVNEIFGEGQPEFAHD